MPSGFYMGLPVGYEVFPGATYEGHTFLPTIEALRRRLTGAQAIWVADAAMFGHENLSALEAAGHRYIVGARFVRMTGKGCWEIDPDRIAEAVRWDGLHGVATNCQC